MTDEISLTLTSAQAGLLVDVIDYWLAEMASVIDLRDPSDVDFLNFIQDLRTRLAELTAS